MIKIILIIAFLLIIIHCPALLLFPVLLLICYKGIIK